MAAGMNESKKGDGDGPGPGDKGDKGNKGPGGQEVSSSGWDTEEAAVETDEKGRKSSYLGKGEGKGRGGQALLSSITYIKCLQLKSHLIYWIKNSFTLELP